MVWSIMDNIHCTAQWWVQEAYTHNPLYSKSNDTGIIVWNMQIDYVIKVVQNVWCEA